MQIVISGEWRYQDDLLILEFDDLVLPVAVTRKTATRLCWVWTVNNEDGEGICFARQ